MKNPQITRWLCVFLIITLLSPIGSLTYELIHTGDDGGLSFVLMMLVFSVINYLFTIRFCSRLLQLKLQYSKKGKYISYLVMTVVSVLFSCFFLSIFSYDLVSRKMNGNDSFLSVSNMDLMDLLTVIGLIIYSLLGLPVFFMQLNVRKKLIQSQENIDDLINAIGTETEIQS